MTYTIIRVREEHLPEILAIERACFSLPWTEAMLRAQLAPEDRIFLAAVDGTGRVAGYVSAMTVLDEGYIANVAVAPEARRRGIARALLTELERRARAIPLAFLTLEVRAGNAPAIALYASLGYETVGRRRNYYEKPVEDALLMTRVLTAPNSEKNEEETR